MITFVSLKNSRIFPVTGSVKEAQAHEKVLFKNHRTNHFVSFVVFADVLFRDRASLPAANDEWKAGNDPRTDQFSLEYPFEI